MKNLLLDIDGVIADFYKGFASHLNDVHGCSLNANTEPESYYISEWGAGADVIDIEPVVLNWILSDGMLSLPAFDGINEFVKKLNTITNVFIVTARVGDWELKFPNSVSQKIKSDTAAWLKNNGIPVDNLYFDHNKIDFCKNNHIDIMVEDKLSTALDAAKNGIKAILIDRKYNKSNDSDNNLYRASSFDDAISAIER